MPENLKIKQIKAKVVYNKKIKGKYFEVSFIAPELIKNASPGQFVNIRITDGLDPLLRRPFSIHRIRNKEVAVLYEVKGKGTDMLSCRKAGGHLDIIGPLGNSFSLPPTTCHLPPILIAGGMGVAPLVFLVEKLKRAKVTALLGAETKKDILCEEEFRSFGCEVKIATDDGSRGFKGKVSELFKEVLPKNTRTPEPITLYACGPKAMLESIAKISNKHRIKAYGSLEAHMACGIGACMGCVVNTKDGYKRVCKEGPVFELSQIVW